MLCFRLQATDAQWREEEGAVPPLTASSLSIPTDRPRRRAAAQITMVQPPEKGARFPLPVGATGSGALACRPAACCDGAAKAMLSKAAAPWSTSPSTRSEEGTQSCFRNSITACWSSRLSSRNRRMTSRESLRLVCDVALS
jgi:hypothetical protein